MGITGSPRLCGGTYFILLLEARGQRMNVRDSFLGKNDGLSEPETLFGLARVVNPDIKDLRGLKGRAISVDTYKFKSCQSYGGGSFMLGDKDVRKSFDDKVRTDYTAALESMCKFVDDFVEVSDETKKHIKLVKALVDLIGEDDSIGDNQLFYVCEDGESLTKSCICSETGTSFCLEAFLLGVWHYALLRPEGNEIGQDTFNEWCSPNGGRHRDYEGTMGENLSGRDITVFRYTATDDDLSSNGEETVDTDAQSSEPESSVKSHSINNPTIFQFVQNGNHNTQIGQVENYYAPQEGGSDEQ